MTLTIVVAVAVTFFMLAAGALLTTVGPWYRNLRKPSWNPPDWVFGPAWTMILGAAAWAGVSAWLNAPGFSDQALIIALYAANIILHMAWSPLFFTLRRPDWALMEVPFLWLSVLALMIGLAPYSSIASWLLLPYLLWVGFAAFLNYTIVRMNAPFGMKPVAE
jgi:translocator protein